MRNFLFVDKNERKEQPSSSEDNNPLRKVKKENKN